ncbi:hypothetical protein BJX63DRAFT_427146 [Aspergillus granulosus]|uniref:Uncharacterized protein n=1 Tax=Aspergillus granulosus TaxID=176169 RepID=A0ABR4I6I2_9EURO
MPIRDSSNLIRNDYPRSKWEDAIDYITEMQQETISLGSRGNNLRIDNQGEFTDQTNGITWYNLQLQENVPRVPGTSTTVFTTFVHKDGYNNWSDHLKSSNILSAMKQQALHQLPESCVYIQKENISAKMVPRSPDGLEGYPIWKPENS